MELNEISGAIIDSVMKVHTALGAGLLESAYEICLTHELRKRGLKVQAQLLSYLKLSNRKIGLLINFNVKYLKSGIKRIAN